MPLILMRFPYGFPNEKPLWKLQWWRCLKAARNGKVQKIIWSIKIGKCRIWAEMQHMLCIWSLKVDGIHFIKASCGATPSTYSEWDCTFCKKRSPPGLPEGNCGKSSFCSSSAGTPCVGDISDYCPVLPLKQRLCLGSAHVTTEVKC